MKIFYDFPVGNDELEPVALGYIRYLKQAGHKVFLDPRAWMNVQMFLGPEGIESLPITEEAAYDVIFRHYQYDNIPEDEKEITKPIIILSSVLTNEIPGSWKEGFDRAAGIIGPSSQVTAVFAQNTDTPTLALPVPVADKPMPDKTPILPSSLEGRKIFLWMGTGSMLDNLYPIIRGYYEAARNMPDAVLVLGSYLDAAYYGGILHTIEKVKEELNWQNEGYPPVYFFDGSTPNASVEDLYYAAYAFVTTSMGDPWAISITRALTFGIPTISTGLRSVYTPQLEVLPVDDATPVMPVPEYGLDPQTMTWNLPSAGTVASVMRALYDDPEKRDAASQRMRETFTQYQESFEANAAALDSFLQEVLDAETQNEES